MGLRMARCPRRRRRHRRAAHSRAGTGRRPQITPDRVRARVHQLVRTTGGVGIRTAEAVLPGLAFNQSRTQRVSLNIPPKLLQIAFLLHQQALVALPPNRTAAAMAAMVFDSVAPIHLGHEYREVQSRLETRSCPTNTLPDEDDRSRPVAGVSADSSRRFARRECRRMHARRRPAHHAFASQRQGRAGFNEGRDHRLRRRGRGTDFFHI